ncbi:MAG: YhcH/YjgK/YiaL family protein [Rickettsiales bacterium]|jgi:YhcH/YjgK/YiaL family protein|nr:YhcH/YjgK/YiaL family protein [Rickettsiales bacterium]
MIFDDIKNIRKYTTVNSHLGTAIDWIESVRTDDLEVKKEYYLDERNVYAFLQEYNTFHSYEKAFEGHFKYIDVQWVISGEEIMEVKLMSGDEKEDIPYDEKKDIYKIKTADEAKILVRENRFALFFPWDLHKPCVSCSYGGMKVRKVVIKIRVDEE